MSVETPLMYSGPQGSQMFTYQEGPMRKGLGVVFVLPLLFSFPSPRWSGFFQLWNGECQLPSVLPAEDGSRVTFLNPGGWEPKQVGRPLHSFNTIMPFSEPTPVDLES